MAFGIPDSSYVLLICIPTRHAKCIHMYKRRLEKVVHISGDLVSISEA